MNIVFIDETQAKDRVNEIMKEWKLFSDINYSTGINNINNQTDCIEFMDIDNFEKYINLFEKHKNCIFILNSLIIKNDNKKIFEYFKNNNKFFIRNELIFNPISLELKNILFSKKYGNIKEAEISFSGIDYNVFYSFAVFLFGKPLEIIKIDDKNIELIFDFEQKVKIINNAKENIQVIGRIIFDSCRIDFEKREKLRIVISEVNREGFIIVFPEGSGDYYFNKYVLDNFSGDTSYRIINYDKNISDTLGILKILKQ